MTTITIAEALARAVEHHQSKRYPEAERLYCQIIAAQPECADALHLLGVLLKQTNRFPEAEILLRKAISLNPGNTIYLMNLAILLTAAGRLEESTAMYRRVLIIDPQSHEARSHLAEDENNLGNQLKEKGQWAGAMMAYKASLALQPDSVTALNNLGIAFRNLRMFDEAIAAHRQAIGLSEGEADSHNNLGNVFYDQGLWQSGILHYRRALELRPDYADALNNLGNAYYEIAEYAEAIKCYQKANHLQPDSHDTVWNLSLVQLLLGQYAEGWAGYESRWKIEKFRPHLRHFSQPLWGGEPLEGRTILLHAEQGIGDAIQFLRYIPMVADRGGRIILEVQPGLIRLLNNFKGVATLIARGDRIPDFSVHCPLMSLPFAFQTTLVDIPHKAGYLAVDPQNSEQWKHRLSLKSESLQIGVVWAGNCEHQKDRERSIPFDVFSQIFIQGPRFISLQKHTDYKISDRNGVEQIGEMLEDFNDTAAVLSNLDLLITVDTAVAHLAGAMGKPVWLLLQYSPDWRWLLDRSDSPWYSSIRIFRQIVPGDWTSVLCRVAAELSVLIKTL